MCDGGGGGEEGGGGRRLNISKEGRLIGSKGRLRETKTKGD